MFWIAGIAVLTGVLLTSFGWHRERRRTWARRCAAVAALLLLLLPVSGMAFIFSVFGSDAETLDTTSLLVFGPAFLSLALGLSAAALSRDWR